jgi:hypothetical protein
MIHRTLRRFTGTINDSAADGSYNESRSVEHDTQTTSAITITIQRFT